ncbi:unnamed protein product [Moneuplotes crassus]|uniref:Uncharacterized protein n=1 Tax=Euplotes crassus TaxID=5936 RepID=A0AAD1XU70_EUPCR|nr:unnamed protein product [Moneuplotes crassus]
MKLVLVLILGFIASISANGITVDLGSTAFGDKFEMTSVNYGQFMIGFNARVSESLQANQTLEIVCGQTGSDFKVLDGSKAFAFQMHCKNLSEGCENPSAEKFYSSSISPYSSGYIWEKEGYDLGKYWVSGTYGPFFTSANYNIMERQAWKTNFPLWDETTHLVCLSQKSSLGEQGTTDFTNYVQLKADQFTKHNVVFSPSSESIKDLLM